MKALTILLTLAVQATAQTVQVTCPNEPGQGVTTRELPRASAFMVVLNEHYSPSNFLQREGVLKYDTVVTNVGSDYNKSSGKYTAPVNGTYTFSLRFAAKEGKEAAGRLFVDDDGMGKVWVYSIPKWATASSTWILRLSQGQQVWVKLVPEALHFYGNWYCALTGSLLHGE